MVVIDGSLAKRLHIDENTLFEEKIIDGGILLRIISDQDYSHRQNAAR